MGDEGLWRGLQWEMKVCGWDCNGRWRFVTGTAMGDESLRLGLLVWLQKSTGCQVWARSFHSCCLSSWAVESYTQLLLQYILMHHITSLQCGYRHSILDMVKWWSLTNLKYKAVPENLCFWFSTQKEVNQPCGIYRGNTYILHWCTQVRTYICTYTEYSTYTSCGYWQVCVHIHMYVRIYTVQIINQNQQSWKLLAILNIFDSRVVAFWWSST